MEALFEARFEALEIKQAKDMEALEALKHKHEALEIKHKTLKIEHEAHKIKQAKDMEALEIKHAQDLDALEIKQAKDLEALQALEIKHGALKTEYAALHRCFEVEVLDGGGSTKLHVKDECELNVHGDHTTHGHHTIKGGNLFVSNGKGSPECSSDDGDGDEAAIKCSGMGNIIVGHQHDELKAGHKAITDGQSQHRPWQGTHCHLPRRHCQWR